MSHKYPIAPNGIFSTIQGECMLSGIPMHFIRLAGCSVGCKECDTDYSVSERLSVAEIVDRLDVLPKLEWVWLTGGEPTDHPIGELLRGLKACGYKVAIATSGVRERSLRDELPITDGIFDFVSVSPHNGDERWVLRTGTQLNVVPGLNGLRLDDFSDVDSSSWGSMWVTPMWSDGHMSSVQDCVKFTTNKPCWRVNVQAHKFLQLP